MGQVALATLPCFEGLNSQARRLSAASCKGQSATGWRGHATPLRRQSQRLNRQACFESSGRRGSSHDCVANLRWRRANACFSFSRSDGSCVPSWKNGSSRPTRCQQNIVIAQATKVSARPTPAVGMWGRNRPGADVHVRGQAGNKSQFTRTEAYGPVVGGAECFARSAGLLDDLTCCQTLGQAAMVPIASQALGKHNVGRAYGLGGLAGLYGSFGRVRNSPGSREPPDPTAEPSPVNAKARTEFSGGRTMLISGDEIEALVKDPSRHKVTKINVLRARGKLPVNQQVGPTCGLCP